MVRKFSLVKSNAARKKISAVLATYNQKPFAYKSIESIAAQVDEVVVVDDNSSDGTQEELERAREQFGNLEIILNSVNKGVSASLNSAIGAASSEFIILSAGDDISLPDRIAIQRPKLESNPGKFLFSEPEIIDEADLLLKRIRAAEFIDRVAPDDIYFRLLTQGNFLCATSAAFAKSRFLELGGFEEGLEQLQDWSLWLKAAATGDIVVSKKPVSRYRKHFGNLSGANNGKRKEVLLKARIETAYILSREIETIRQSHQLSSLLLKGLTCASSLHFNQQLVSDAFERLLKRKLLVDKAEIIDFLSLVGPTEVLQARSSAQFFNWVTRQPSQRTCH